jgi:DNA-binding protein Fis
MDANGTEVPDRKEIKVKIFEEQHVKLHTLKILQGQTIGDSVEDALDAYFEQLDEGETGVDLEQVWDQGPGSLA